MPVSCASPLHRPWCDTERGGRDVAQGRAPSMCSGLRGQV